MTRDRPIYKRIDWTVLAAVGGLCAMSVAFVASADPMTAGGSIASGKALRQIVWVLIGASAMACVLKVGYRRVLQWSTTLYAIFLVLLVGVLFTRPINGATSWFDLRVLRFQPSEFTKLVVMLTIAQLLMYSENYKRIRGLMIPLAIALVPVALILKQPDMGTAMTFFPVLFAMLFAAGARLRHLALVGACGGAGTVGLWLFVMSSVQKMRVYSWLDPLAHQATEAYQLIQSLIAIGSGGLTGKGYALGPQNRLGRIPERETDFISAVIGEEWGLLGLLLILGLFLFIILSGLSVAGRTRDPAGRLVAVGVSALLAGQVFINISVASGLLPTTGIALPLMSYGGSSMVASLIAIGLLLSVDADKPVVFGQDHFST